MSGSSSAAGASAARGAGGGGAGAVTVSEVGRVPCGRARRPPQRGQVRGSAVASQRWPQGHVKAVVMGTPGNGRRVTGLPGLAQAISELSHTRGPDQGRGREEKGEGGAERKGARRWDGRSGRR